MRALRLPRSWAFSLVCEVALRLPLVMGFQSCGYVGRGGLRILTITGKTIPARNPAEMAAVACFSIPCTSSYGETATRTASCSKRVRNVVQLSTRGTKSSAEITRLSANFDDMCSQRIAHVQPSGSGIPQLKSFGSVIAHVRSGRSVMYDETENYVLMEPGEDEQFVTAEELQAKLKTCLKQWQGKQLPPDLARFKTVEEAVEYLMTSVCELELGDGQGSVQWYEVRLD